MPRGVLVSVLATAMATLTTLLAASAAAGRTLISLRPASGRSTTTFVVRFRHPDSTGVVGPLRRTDLLALSATGSGRGCVSRATLALPEARQGQIVAIKLRPRRFGGRWCAGRFWGRIRESTGIVCRVTHPVCPVPAIIWRTITTFSFRVRHRGGGSQTQGPTFGGLARATTCIVLTANPPVERRIFTLSWNPATDPTTPSSAIVYDIYYSPAPGGEDYLDPTWTTAAGATSFSASVGPGPAYFVVRARDRAGREDQNRIERAGVSMCS
jgi:hypothetical protein